MKHLGYLKIINFLYAGFMAGAAILVVLVVQGIWVLRLLGMNVPEVTPLHMVLISVVAVVLLLLAWLYYKAGRIVGAAQGRKLQAVLIALSIGNCPGILYAGYALWVCFIQAETVAAFSGEDPQ